MPIIGLAIGAGAGLLKSELVDRPKEKRERRLAAATQRYSPWTGLRADKVQEADPMGSMMQFGATGASMGSGIANQQAQTDWLNKGYTPYGGGGSPYAGARSSYGPGPGMFQSTPQSPMNGYNSPYFGQIGSY